MATLQSTRIFVDFPSQFNVIEHEHEDYSITEFSSLLFFP